MSHVRETEVKNFRVRVEHHKMPGAEATIRLDPQNYCLATITGIDGATRTYNAEMADRLGVAFNLTRGIDTQELMKLAEAGVTLAVLIEQRNMLLSVVEKANAEVVQIRTALGAMFPAALVASGEVAVDQAADRPRG